MTSAATGTSATPTAARRPTARFISTPPRTRSASPTSRWTAAIPTSLTTPRSISSCANTPTTSRCATGSASSTVVERAERLDGGGWSVQTSDGERQEFDALLVCNGHHWDPSLPDFPGQLRRRHAPLPPLHRPQRSARSVRQAGGGRRDRQQRRRHRLRAIAQGGRRRGVPVDPQRRLGDPQVHPRPPGRPDRQDHPVAADRPSAPARAGGPAVRLGPDGGLRPADSQPPLPRGPSDRVQRAAAAPRLR